MKRSHVELDAAHAAFVGGRDDAAGSAKRPRMSGVADDAETADHRAARRETVVVGGEALRRVLPYLHTFPTSVKRRWIGRTILDIFLSDFGSHDAEYFRQAIEHGTIRVGGEQVQPNLVLKDGMRITHTLHRHEPDVPATAVAVLHEEEELVVLVKPAGLPVHPCGSCRYNSLVSILVGEYGFPLLHPIHRLDRLTSGVLLLSKPPAAPAAKPPRASKARRQRASLLGTSADASPTPLVAPAMAALANPAAAGAVLATEAVAEGAAGGLSSTAPLLPHEPAQSAASRLAADIREGRMLKRYLARVKGAFPAMRRGDCAPSASVLAGGAAAAPGASAAPAVAPGALEGGVSSPAGDIKAVPDAAGDIKAVAGCGCTVCIQQLRSTDGRGLQEAPESSAGASGDRSRCHGSVAALGAAREPFLSSFRPSMTGSDTVKELAGSGDGAGEELNAAVTAHPAAECSAAHPAAEGAAAHYAAEGPAAAPAPAASGGAPSPAAAGAAVAAGSGVASPEAAAPPVAWTLDWRCPDALRTAAVEPPQWGWAATQQRIAADCGRSGVDAATGPSTGPGTGRPAPCAAGPASDAAHTSGLSSFDAAAAPVAGAASAAAVAAEAAAPVADAAATVGEEPCWLQVDIAIVAVDAKQARHGTGIDAAAGKEGRDGREGKESITLFRRLAYDAQTDESLLECRPLHGRSHQIRVHLAWLGFPIADDPMYCPDALAALQARDAALIAAEGADAARVAADAPVEAALPVGSCATDAAPGDVSAAGISAAVAGAGASATGPLSSAASQATATQPLEAAARAICAACRYGPRKEFNVMQRLCRGISLHSWSYCRRPVRAPSSLVASDGWAGCAATRGQGSVDGSGSIAAEGTAAGTPTLDTPGCYLVGSSVATAAQWCFTSPLPDWSLRFLQQRDSSAALACAPAGPSSF